MTKKNPFANLNFDEALRRLSKVSRSEIEESLREDAKEIIRGSQKRIKKARKEIDEGIVPKDGYRF